MQLIGYSKNGDNNYTLFFNNNCVMHMCHVIAYYGLETMLYNNSIPEMTLEEARSLTF